MFDQLPERVAVYEVGPRDGLQNEPRMVSTPDKVALIDALSATGLAHIEITSFVSPRWTPQLGDASEVARQVTRREGVSFSALVPNRRGFEAARAAAMGEIAVFISASELHNKQNVNKSIDQTLAGFAEVIAPARAAGMRVRAYVSTVFGCPYAGDIDPRAVVDLARTLQQMGVYQVSLGDTIGVAVPTQVARLLDMVFAELPPAMVAVHFHDTEGRALANCLVALSRGVTTIDSAIGGLGGCPYAPGASGNLATEDLVAMLIGMGIETGVDVDALVDCSRLVAAFVGRELPSKYLKAHLGKRARERRRSEKAEQ